MYQLNYGSSLIINTNLCANIIFYKTKKKTESKVKVKEK